MNGQKISGIPNDIYHVDGNLYITREPTKLLNQRRKDQRDPKRLKEANCSFCYEYTCNPVKGICDGWCNGCCIHGCGKYNEYIEKNICLYWQDALLATTFGYSIKHIYLQSSNDLFQPGVPDWVIEEILSHLKKYPKNAYYFHTKFPERAVIFIKAGKFPPNIMVGVSIESDHDVISEIGPFTKAPSIINRAKAVQQLVELGIRVTVSAAPFFMPNSFSEFTDLIIGMKVPVISVSHNQNRKMAPEFKSQLVTLDHKSLEQRNEMFWNVYDFGDKLWEAGIYTYMNEFTITKLGFSEIREPWLVTWGHKRLSEKLFKVKIK